MLVSEKKAAEFLATTPGALRVQRCVGQKKNGAPVVPFVKMGRKIAYDVADLQAYVDRHRVRLGEAV